MIIFDGKTYAAEKIEQLRQRLPLESQKLRIWSLVFEQDVASLTYSKLKATDAEKLGIPYERVIRSLHEPLDSLVEVIRRVAQNSQYKGMIIQKPPQTLIPDERWWASMVSAIPVQKDIDGLREDSHVLPATARAIVQIVREGVRQLQLPLRGLHAVVVGRSSIVGKPASKELAKLGLVMQNWGREELRKKRHLLQEAEVVVVATGQADLLRMEDFKPGVILVDAGSPRAEITRLGIEEKAAFLSPVPGGVGPVTRACLLENFLDLVQ